MFLIGLLVFLAGAAFLPALNPALAQRKFERKECLDCHTKFADKYLGMKTIHTIVKEKKCDDCHLRHGKVPALILKKSGNELCYTCHSKEKMGVAKGKVHTAVRVGKCTNCHDPHATQTSHLLKHEGASLCTQCHQK